jgi:hypothetical protein
MLIGYRCSELVRRLLPYLSVCASTVLVALVVTILFACAPRGGAPADGGNMGESGVSMDMEVTEESLHEDSTGEIGELKDSILDSRPEGDSLSWPVKKDEKK